MIKQILLLALACAPAAAFGGRIRIGAALPLSGSKAEQGVSILHAVQLHVDEINAAGGIGGRQLELVVRDDQNEPAKAAGIAQEFAKDDGMLAVVGDYDEEPALQALPFYDHAHLPVFLPSIGNPQIIHASPFAFSGTYSDDRAVETLAAYLRVVRGFKSVLVFHNDDPYGTHLFDEFAAKAGRMGIRVRAIGYEGDPTRDLPSGFLAKRLTRQDAAADAVVLFSHTARGASVIEQLRARGVKAPIFGSDRLAANLEKVDGSLTENIQVAFPFLYDFAPLTGDQFRARFARRFGTQPTVFAAFAYDGLGMIARALEKKADRGAVRDFLAAYDSPTKAYDGVTGPQYFDKDGAMTRDTVMAFMRRGSWKPCFTQLRRVLEAHTLSILPEKIKEGEVIVADGVPFFKIKVVYAGVDYYRVNQVNVKDLNFESEFFLWYKWQGDLDVDNIGFINELPGRGTRVAIRDNYAEAAGPDAVKWISYKVKGVFLYPYDLKLFPFDTQHLPLLMAHRSKNANKIQIVADEDEETDRRISNIYPQEWRDLGREDFSGTFSFDSTFGNPAYTPGETQAPYSVYQSNMVIKRVLFPYLITLFMPLALLMGVSLLVLLIPKEQFAPRNGLVMSSLLGVLVYHMAQARSLPQVGYLMRADLYFVVAYFLLFSLVLGLNVVNLLLTRKQEEAAAKLDRRLRYFFGVGTVLAYTVLTLSAFWTTAP